MITERCKRSMKQIYLKWSYPDKLGMISDCFKTIEILNLKLIRMTEFPFDFTKFCCLKKIIIGDGNFSSYNNKDIQIVLDPISQR